jgi:hypothetical protein
MNSNTRNEKSKPSTDANEGYKTKNNSVQDGNTDLLVGSNSYFDFDGKHTFTSYGIDVKQIHTPEP